MEEVDEKNAEFEISDYFKKRSKYHCPTSLLRVPLCYRPSFLGDLKEVDEKNAEFENSDNQGSKSQCLMTGLYTCYRNMFFFGIIIRNNYLSLFHIVLVEEKYQDTAHSSSLRFGTNGEAGYDGVMKCGLKGFLIFYIK